jgi:histidinol-phosphate aminotransferase
MNGWEKNLRAVEPYTPGEQPQRTDIIKLNTNENPYPPAPGVAKLLAEMDSAQFRKYPDPEASLLVAAIADFYGLKKEQVFTGVGSDDVLGMAFLTLFNGPKPVLFPNITYSFYDVWANLFRIPYETPALDADFRIVKEDYFRDNGGIVIANPNAPTGVALPLSEIEEIVKRNPDSAVIIDEAYVDFGAESALPLIGRYENLLVVQTFSKSRSMAGIRIGFAMGSEKMIAALKRVKYSYNSYTMNLPSILLGAETLKDRDYFEKTTARIVATRERVKKELHGLGFVFGDSKTNFIFAGHPELDAGRLFEDLREAGIFVRHFDKPLVRDYLRITIGTDGEMDRLTAFLRSYIEEKRKERT